MVNQPAAAVFLAMLKHELCSIVTRDGVRLDAGVIARFAELFFP